MLVAIGDSLSNLPCTNNGKDQEDEDDAVREQGKLSEDDEPGWVTGTISKMVQQHIERCQQKLMKGDKLTLPRWGDTADYDWQSDKTYCTSELRVLAVVKLQTDDNAAAPAPTTFW